MDGDTTERLSQESQCPMQKIMAYWREHPLSLEECLAQFKRLRERRLARESKLQG
jgi:Zn ribbon nucleic-acid-binding protein